MYQLSLISKNQLKLPVKQFLFVGQNIGLMRRVGEEKRKDANNIHLWVRLPTKIGRHYRLDSIEHFSLLRIETVTVIYSVPGCLDSNFYLLTFHPVCSIFNVYIGYPKIISIFIRIEIRISD